jgi:three-Cys-motif partner protein
MGTCDFFAEQSDQSEVKANIVAKYFMAWANVMLGVKRQYGRIDRIGYIDLFAGPGRYEDGSKSTPLMVLEKALANRELAEILVTMFNDKDENNVASLRQAIKGLPGLAALKHEPMVYCGEVGADAEAMFKRIRMCPTFSFVDPFGYKGLSRGFIQAMVKDWGVRLRLLLQLRKNQRRHQQQRRPSAYGRAIRVRAYRPNASYHA